MRPEKGAFLLVAAGGGLGAAMPLFFDVTRKQTKNKLFLRRML